MTNVLVDAPKVRKVLSSRPITMQAAHHLLARFLQEEREDGVLGGVDEVLTRLEAVCHSLLPTSQTQEINETELEKAKRKAAAKRKRRSEEESSSGGSKKMKTR